MFTPVAEKLLELNDRTSLTRMAKVHSLGLTLTSLTFLAVTVPKVQAVSFTIDTNFTGTTFRSSDAGSTSIPPDTMGAVGKDHFVELINGRYSVYNKSDTTRVQTSTLNQFWSNAGVTPRGLSAFDPRVTFDPFSQRWYATSVDNARQANNFLLAVSNSTDPTAGWKGFAIDSDSTNQRWADYPTLGFDKDGVYLAANMFSITTGASALPTLTTLIAASKADLLSGTLTKTVFENQSSSRTGFTVQPVIDLDNSGLPASLLSAFNTSAGSFKQSSFTGSIASPTLNTSGGFINVTPYKDPLLGAKQPGRAKPDLDTGDNRLSSNVILKNGVLWGVQTVAQDKRAALCWFKINASTNTLFEEGLIADPDFDYSYGSLAVNAQGNVVIGFSGLSNTKGQFASTYAAVGETAGGSAFGSTTFTVPVLLKAGVAGYFQDFGSGRNRWGDYSATTIDPEDAFSFWTIQEFVSAEDTWSTQITKINIRVPEPNAMPMPVVLLGGLGLGASLWRKWRSS